MSNQTGSAGNPPPQNPLSNSADIPPPRPSLHPLQTAQQKLRYRIDAIESSSPMQDTTSTFPRIESDVEYSVQIRQYTHLQPGVPSPLGGSPPPGPWQSILEIATSSVDSDRPWPGMIKNFQFTIREVERKPSPDL